MNQPVVQRATDLGDSDVAFRVISLAYSQWRNKICNLSFFTTGANMIKLSYALVIAGAMLLLSTSTLAQSSSQSVTGVWKVVAVETKEVVSGRVSRPFGETPTGTFVFTHGGQTVAMQYASNRKAHATSNPIEAERVGEMKTSGSTCRFPKSPLSSDGERSRDAV
jgi:hypothetical protein